MAKVKKQVQKASQNRPPIVSILGHVDHGKTTLLDFIRKTNVAGHEHGGITQHVGAYQINTPENFRKKHPEYAEKITFIDTPGHYAFAKMRSQGATVSDIAVLVIAANDGVKPQSIESIDHIKNAKIPSIVALNKIDLPNINEEKVKKQLDKAGVKLEEYGGETPLVPLSAKTGKGVDKLLDSILFLSDFNQIKEHPGAPFKGVVIESSLSKYKGITATVLVRDGQIEVGKEVINANQLFKIRALNDWQGKHLKKARAGDPVEILGWKTLPVVGSQIYKESESEIKQQEAHELEKTEKKTLVKTDQEKELEEEKIKLILKADTLGTLEAIRGGLGNEVEIIHQGVGLISESDILLAKTAKALVIGFNQKPSSQVEKLAQSEKVLIKTYNLIYELFDEITDVIEAIRKGNLVEVLGEAKVLQVFEMKGETIAGAKVVKGRIARGDQIKIMRNDEEIGKTKIKSLRHFKEDITKAELGKEVGIGLAQKMEILTGDSIISIG